jgi:hypothetical protein
MQCCPESYSCEACAARRPRAGVVQSYVAHGEADFFGEDALARTDGAGGPALTEHPPVRFEWLAAA